VLIPPVLPDIVQTAKNAGDFNLLVAALEASGLDAALMEPGPFTVFAPTDDAFNALPDGALDALLADPTGELTNILLYHVVEGKLKSSDVIAVESIHTLLGQDLQVTIEGDTVKINDVLVIITDIKAENGIIHVINAVLIPAQPD
jgi:uncharacterized surface protein with fasciclin (FAS1) repeats